MDGPARLVRKGRWSNHRRPRCHPGAGATTLGRLEVTATQPHGKSLTDRELIASTPNGLRILAFCDYFSDESYGGIERVALEIYKRLARMGCQIAVLTA